jgi:hypothetical protein
MAKTNASPDQYDNKDNSIFPFYDRFFVNMYNAFGRALSSEQASLYLIRSII